MESLEQEVAKNKGTLTLSEWDSLKIRRINFQELQDRISPSKKDRRIEQLSVYDLFGPKLKALHYVGAVGFEPPIPLSIGDSITKTEDNGDDGNTIGLKTIIVKPKIGDTNFLKMFQVAHGIKLPKILEKIDLLEKFDMAVILIVYLYVNAVEELFKKYLRRAFELRIMTLNSRIRGKLLVGRYVCEKVAKGIPQNTICQFYELTADTLLNRIIKAGLKSAKSLVTYFTKGSGWSELLGRISHLISFMGNVSDERISAIDFARLRFHAQNRYYEYPIEIAKMLIFENCFDYSVKDPPVRCAASSWT